MTVLVAALAPSVWAQPLAPLEFRDEIELGEWVTYYYRKPEPARLPAALEYYVASSLFANANGRIPLAQFAAEVVRDDPALADELFARAADSGSDAFRAFTLHVLWLADTEQTRASLDDAAAAWGESASSVVARMKVEAPTNLFAGRVESSGEIDRLWGVFLATGAVAPVERVAGVLAWETNDPAALLVRDAARWSLLSNAVQHDRVLTYLGEIARRAEGVHAERLADVVADVMAEVSGADAEAGDGS